MSSWRAPAPWFSAAWCALVLAVFWATARSIEAIWARSDTYAHGYLIIPIVLWLVWRQRHVLAGLSAQPRPAIALLILPVAAAWLLAAVSDVLIVQQLALVTVLLLGLWTLLGTPIVRSLLFPLLFLYFAIPMGEGLVQPMMQITADFTVAMLQLTGIPVYREGLFFSLPSGNWSVVEACSGVRYLIASVTLGCLFAYLTYTGWRKRLLFILASIAVPVLANGLRAYMIVMIGHLSGMEHAVGVDHLIYGWLFFGVVIFLMFAVGSIWRDPEPEAADQRTVVADTPPGPRPQTLLFRGLAPAAAAIVLWPVLAGAMLAQQSVPGSLALALPDTLGAWTAVEGDLGWQPRTENPDAELLAHYTRGGTPVAVYIAHYASQRPNHEVTTSSNRVTATAERRWRLLREGSARAEGAGVDISVRDAAIAGGGGQLQVWQWYRVGDRHTGNRYLAKIHEVLARLSFGRLDAAWIALATPVADDAQQTLQAAFADMVGPIEAALDAMLDEQP